MKKSIFTMSEIITIVMSEVDNIEYRELYGFEMEEEDLPLPIRKKIDLMESKEFCEFNDKVKSIAEEVYPLKSGELNELNKCHEEIDLLASEELKDYII